MTHLSARGRLLAARSLGRLRPPLIAFYDRHGERLGLDRIESALTPPPRPVNRRFDLEAIEGTVPDIRFLVGTSAAGLLLFDGPEVVQLFDRYARRHDDGIGGYYGITRRGDRWYVYHRVAATGRVISFRLEGRRAVDARTELSGLSRSVHQIDFIDDDLWVVDTYDNRVLVVPAAALGRGWRRAARVLYPNGVLASGVSSENYSHFNSVYGWGGTVCLVAHNETTKTQRRSELFLLDRDGQVIGRQDLGGSCCHNVARLDGEWVTCCSWEGTVTLGGREVLSLGSFTRGLALGPDFHVIGASGIESRRAARDLSRSRIVITDRSFAPLATISLRHTQVQEVRRVDVDDLGLSDTSRDRSPGP